MGHPRSPTWTLDFEPAFSPRFPLSPRSIFPTAQRFPIRKHVTSGLGHVTSGDVTSGSDHVISGHFRFRSCDFRFRVHQNEATSKRGHDIKTRLSSPNRRTLLLRFPPHFCWPPLCAFKLQNITQWCVISPYFFHLPPAFSRAPPPHPHLFHLHKLGVVNFVGGQFREFLFKLNRN